METMWQVENQGLPDYKITSKTVLCQALACCKQASWAILVQVWMTKLPRQTEDSAGLLQRRVRTRLETGQRPFVWYPSSESGYFLHALRSGKRQNVMD